MQMVIAEYRLRYVALSFEALSIFSLFLYITWIVLNLLELLKTFLNKLVLINDIRFKGKKREEWKEVENYLKEYVGEFYEIEETSEIDIYFQQFSDEYAGSESRPTLKGAVTKAKAAQGISELIQIAANGEYSENTKKYEKDSKYGWYRYDVRFALPIYDDKSGDVYRYNLFFAWMLVCHDTDGKKYLYDLLAIKKRAARLSKNCTVKTHLFYKWLYQQKP